MWSHIRQYFNDNINSYSYLFFAQVLILATKTVFPPFFAHPFTLPPGETTNVVGRIFFVFTEVFYLVLIPAFLIIAAIITHRFVPFTRLALSNMDDLRDLLRKIRQRMLPQHNEEIVTWQAVQEAAMSNVRTFLRTFAYWIVFVIELGMFVVVILSAFLQI